MSASESGRFGAFRWLRGLRFKTTALVGVIVLGTSMVTIAYFSHFSQELILRHSSDRLEAVLKSFTFNSEYGLLIRDVQELDRLVEGVQGQKDILFAFVLDKEGHILSSPPEPVDFSYTLKIVQDFNRRVSGKAVNRSIFYEETLDRLGKVNVIGGPVYSEKRQGAQELDLFDTQESAEKEIIGYGVIVFSPKSIDREVKSVRNQISFISGLLALCVMAFIYILTLILVRQLDQIKQAFQEVGAGKSVPRLSIRTGDELEELSDGFNRMARDLQETTVSRDALAKEIEDRKRLEGIVLQSEKMAAVGQLAGGVAHEINNPLGIILGFSQGIVGRLKPGDPLEMPLKSIEREAIRCKQLVQDLLTFSRSAKTEKESIDPNKVIESSLSLVLAHSKIKSVQLLKELSPNLPPIFGNLNQLQQVIINLCNNAIDAMPNGGKITLRTRRSEFEHGPAIEIQIQDTGQGIPKEIQPKIFEPFFTTKDVGKGTGLGLSLVYEIIQKHQGKITVESEAGKGTLFRVLLPFDISGGVSKS